jgi:hypothetical protein
VEAKQFAPEIRAELFTLDKSTADTVARHLVAAGELLDTDLETAATVVPAAPCDDLTGRHQLERPDHS